MGGRGMRHEQVPERFQAFVRMEAELGLGVECLVEDAGEFGGEGHAALGVDDAVVGPDEGDPEQGACLRRRFRRVL